MGVWACVLLVTHLLMRAGVCQANGKYLVETDWSLTSQDRAESTDDTMNDIYTLDPNKKFERVVLSSDKLEAKGYGAVQSTHLVEATASSYKMYYFQMKVLTGGWGTIIGLATREYSSHNFDDGPADRTGSYLYASRSGKIISDNGRKEYGPKYGAGDIVGCGINIKTGEVFFTKNGEYLGIAFTVPNMKEKLYPTFFVNNTKIRVNLVFDTKCKTKSETTTGYNCVFPFSYKGKRYDKCTTEGRTGGKWCATMKGKIEKGYWGYCNDKCEG